MRARLITAVVLSASSGVYLARGFGTNLPALSFFDTLSARNNSSPPVSEHDVLKVVESIQVGLPSPFHRAVSFRTLAGTSFLVPLVKVGTGAMLLTFPGSGGSPIVGLFTSDEALDAVRKENGDKNIYAETMSGSEIYHMMQQTSDPKAVAGSDPSNRVARLSVNGHIIADNWTKVAPLWNASIKQNVTRTTLQAAHSSAEVDRALISALGKDSFWCVVEHKQHDGSWSAMANQMGSENLLLAFCAYDIAARVTRDEDPKQVRIVTVQGENICRVASRIPMGLVHDMTLDGQVGFVTLDANKVDRISKLRA